MRTVVDNFYKAIEVLKKPEGLNAADKVATHKLGNYFKVNFELYQLFYWNNLAQSPDAYFKLSENIASLDELPTELECVESVKMLEVLLKLSNQGSKNFVGFRLSDQSSQGETKHHRAQVQLLCSPINHRCIQ